MSQVYAIVAGVLLTSALTVTQSAFQRVIGIVLALCSLMVSVILAHDQP